MGEIGSRSGGRGAMAVSENPDPASISKENWGLAEEIAREVVHGVHPTVDTDERRSNVIDYLQRILKASFGLEVFSYGSVPLKTYLPDGDIDLTILSNGPGTETSWANDVLSVLKWEEANEYAEFKVKEIQFIDAEVKILKCIVQNIIIDISFNQFGGVCTLCFLEQVDRIIGRDHLFKRSIILIKAWCYYESRILGAHHGLLSTYALETLVLFIFQLFHASLDGPLSVLYRFLDYFSKFDWENCCISLKGPVLKSSLPEIVGPIEEDRLMLTDEFLRNCIELFAMTPLGEEETTRKFTPKHINIIDPLREYNNLGRSVNKGNFYRIRSAFRYGARKLGKALTLPKDEIAKEINNFFSDIINRHESKCETFAKEYNAALLSQPAFLPEDHMQLMPSGTDSEYDPCLMEEKDNTYYSGLYSARYASSLTMPGYNYSGYRFNGNSSDIARYSYLDARTSTTTSDCSPSSNPSMSSLGQYGQPGQVPLLSLTNQNSRNAYSSQIDTWDYAEEKTGLDTWLEGKDSKTEMAYNSQSCSDSLDGYSLCSSGLSSPKSNSLESLSLDFRELDIGSGDESEPLNPLADLTGDYDSHIRSLLHGPFFHKFDHLESTLLHTPPSPLQFESNQPWFSAPQSMPSESGLLHPPQTQLQYENSQQWLPVPQPMPSEQPAYHQMYHSNVSIAPPGTPAFPSEDPQKARGTGTYFPNMNNYSWEHDYAQNSDVQYVPYVPLQQQLSRPSSASSWRHGQPQRYPNGNNYNSSISEINNSPRGCYVSEINNSPRGSFVSEINNSPRGSFVSEINNSPRVSFVSEINNSPKGGPEYHPVHVKKKSAVSCQSPGGRERPNRANSPEKINFGSIGNLVDEVISAPPSSCAMASKKHQNASSSSVTNAEAKVADKPFALKNEDEFPPLSV